MSDLKELRKIMIEHREADRLIQGSWWQGGKGCFYGCATHWFNRNAIEKAIDKFGIEPWVAHWSEKVFEGLPENIALDWPVELLDAMIAFDGDYQDVFHKLSIKRLESLLPTGDENVDDAINQVIDYHKAPTEEKRVAAGSVRWAAESVRWAAESADSAAWQNERLWMLEILRGEL